MPGRPPAEPVVARADAEAEQLFYTITMQPVEDPYPLYHQLRNAAPALLTGDGTLVLSRHVDCNAALRNRSLGKGDEWLKLQLKDVSKDDLRGVMELMQHSMILTNPPQHTRLRRIVSSASTGRHVEALRDGVTRRVDGLLDRLAARPGADLMTELAMPLPVSTTGDLLGIPEADRTELVPVIHELGLLMEPASGPAEINRGVAQAHLASYLGGLIAEKRQRPQDDLLSRLASTSADALDRTEMIATALLLFGAGNTPTANLIGNGLDALFRFPESRRRLTEDPGLLPSAVEEMLRFDSPSQFDVFTVLEPHSFAGTELRPGQGVMMMLGAANHDPERFDDPDDSAAQLRSATGCCCAGPGSSLISCVKSGLSSLVGHREYGPVELRSRVPDAFDVARKENGHLSFAAGIHHCLGAHLARLQAEVVFGRLLARFPKLEPAAPAVRHPGLGNRGFDSVSINLLG